MPGYGLQQFGYDPGKYYQAKIESTRRFSEKLGEGVKGIAGGIAKAVSGTVAAKKEDTRLRSQANELYKTAASVNQIIASDDSAIGERAKTGMETGAYTVPQPPPLKSSTEDVKKYIEDLNSGINNLITNVAGSGMLSSKSLAKVNNVLSASGIKADLSKPLSAARGEEQGQQFASQILQGREVGVPAGAPAPEAQQAYEAGQMPEGQQPLPTPPKMIRQFLTAQQAQQQALGLSPEAIATGKPKAVIDILTQQEKDIQAKIKETQESMDKSQAERLSRISTSSGIDWRVGGKTILFEIGKEQNEIDDRKKQLDGILKGLEKTAGSTAYNKAATDAASLGLPANPNLIASEIGAIEHIQNLYPDYIKGIKDALTAKEQEEKEKANRPRGGGSGSLANEPKTKLTNEVYKMMAKLPEYAQDAIFETRKYQGPYGIEEVREITGWRAGSAAANLINDQNAYAAFVWAHPQQFEGLAKLAGIPRPTGAGAAPTQAPGAGAARPLSGGGLTPMPGVAPKTVQGVTYIKMSDGQWHRQ